MGQLLSFSLQPSKQFASGYQMNSAVAWT